ncbi:hypothetical protein [Clostridium chrysemydis]|uniref:hypothetical protein n=1 Tax=Clostridium chrysemydis TaxID=2665504 RepID=UPI00188436C8|nr:hypothetical protein [Clostridium chrysemydis]
MKKYKNFTSNRSSANSIKESEKSLSTYVKIFILLNIILLSFNISNKDQNVTEESINKESVEKEVTSKNDEISEILMFINSHGSKSEIKDGIGKMKLKTLDSLKELSTVKSFNIIKVEGEEYEVTFE